jgi:hypothetical protein
MYIWVFAQRMNPVAAYDRSLCVSKEMHFFFLMGTLWGDGIQLDGVISPFDWLG